MSVAALEKSLIRPDAPLIEALAAIEASEAKIALVVDGQMRLMGTVTDGDVRRGILKGAGLEARVETVMNRAPFTAREGEDQAHLLAYMRRHSIRHIPIVDARGVLVGIRTLEELINIPERSNWVVLMAGGEGQRLRPLTEDIPKPMLKVGDKPILETIVQGFADSGFRRFFISVNYKSDLIEAYFGDGRDHDVAITYLREEEPLGTAGSLRLLPERPGEPFIVMNGDILTNVSFPALLDFHAEKGAAATMCVREFRFQVPYGVVEAERHLLTGIDEKPWHSWFVNAGIYVLEPEVLAHLPARGAYTMPQLFEQVRAGGGACAVFPISEYWLDVGRRADLEQAKQDIARLIG